MNFNLLPITSRTIEGSSKAIITNSDALKIVAPIIASMIILIVALGITSYIYLSLVYQRIAKNKKLKSSAIAWIPLVGPSLIAAKIAKMPWWPILLLLGIWIPYVGMLLALAFLTFSFIWHYKLFESFKRPGWWIFLSLTPFVGGLIFFILIGVTAWKKN